MRFPTDLSVLLLVVVAPLHADCDFVVDSAGTVKDNDANLVWSRCLLGQSVGACSGNPVAATWVDTLNQARASELGGITNWRMPKIEEIEKLHARSRTCQAEVFPGFRNALIWSASANIDYATDAWAFDVEAGKRVVKARDSRLQVLLVSGPN